MWSTAVMPVKHIKLKLKTERSKRRRELNRIKLKLISNFTHNTDPPSNRHP